MPAQSRILTYSLLPSQTRFVNSTRRHVMYSGGFGSGKSRALCYALVRQAVIPGNEVLLARKTLVSLRKSTLVTLIGGTDPVLPPGSYTLLKSEGVIRVNGGGTIHYMGLDDDGARARSMNLGAVFLDEATDFSEGEFRELAFRLRLPAGSRQLFCVTNPAGQNHHLYRHFFLESSRDREVITASSLENTHLPKDYLEELMTMEGGLRQRYVDGLWVSLEGLIFDTFDRNTHVSALPRLGYDECICGVDYGYTNPTAMVVVGRAGDRIHVLNEFVKAKMIMRDIVEQALIIQGRWSPTFIVDPSAAGPIAELQNAGLTVFPANNDVAAGIDRIRDRLKVRGDSPDLVISDCCLNTIREFESYQYQRDTEKPQKINDHCLDALRYVCNRIDDQRAETGHFRPVLIAAGEEEDADDGWAALR